MEREKQTYNKYYALSKLSLVIHFTTSICSRGILLQLIYVSVLSPSDPSQALAADLGFENCRYDGDYEEAMGVQAKEHQQLVGRLV
jgi:hypothetical protein